MEHGQVNVGLTNSDIRSLVINARGYIFAGTYRWGLFRSTDYGDNWSPANNGLSNSAVIYTLAANANGHFFAGAAGGSIYRSQDDGDTWTQSYTGPGGIDVRVLAVTSRDAERSRTWAAGFAKIEKIVVPKSDFTIHHTTQWLDPTSNYQYAIPVMVNA